jgi:Zn-dependent peptidase ImmA (M78 family)
MHRRGIARSPSLITNKMMERERNGRMITLARELKGISQSVLATKVPNLNQSTLSQLEVGTIDVPYSVWNDIADYFELPLSFFTLERPKMPISSFYYRKRQTMPKKQLAELEAKMDILRMSIDKLLDIVDIPEFKLPFFDIENYQEKRKAAGETARRIREFLKIPKGPIANLVETLEQNGIIVYYFKDAPEKFDGITLFSDKVQPIIFINESIPNDRKRFTIAHELGHLVLHVRTTQDLDRDEETEANYFASEFLMPEIEIKHTLHYLNLINVTNLKEYWKVSKSAIIRRAFDLGIIDQGKYTYFNIELSRRGERKVETGFVGTENTIILKNVISTIKRELNISIEDICSMLCLPKNLYDNLVKVVSLVSFSKRMERPVSSFSLLDTLHENRSYKLEYFLFCFAQCGDLAFPINHSSTHLQSTPLASKQSPLPVAAYREDNHTFEESSLPQPSIWL